MVDVDSTCFESLKSGKLRENVWWVLQRGTCGLKVMEAIYGAINRG